ncbi:GNAT family N-acetyltransferase [Anaerostipes sp.]|uniref:GNAT family N-acetyltransferase n=1 Tax=Anaerostipes sp. TaxID=1872530 RepID=UPI0025C68D31|nr:GNAT family N-acetyltransferase [Anaerostipes sp.]MBS7007111.1 GNAT family N-acetyltransferase [Anaerostipes sp.]
MESIYRDKNWYLLQENKEKGKAVKYVYEDKTGRIEYSFIKRAAGNLNGIEYFDIVTARGVGGPYLEELNYKDRKNELIQNFNNQFQQYCKENNIVAELIRFDPWKRNEEDFKYIYEIELYGHFYCNDLRKDFYKEEYNRRSKRSIKKANSMEVKVQVDEKGKTIEEFIKLYKYTEQKYHTSDYYNIEKAFVEEYFKALKGKVVILNAIYGETIIASVIMLLGKDIAHYHLLGNNPEYSECQANSLLTYHAALYAQEKGKKLFDMGGGIAGGNIETFKLNFVNKENIFDYYIAKKIRMEEIYDALVEQAGGARENYFPAYRK